MNVHRYLRNNRLIPEMIMPSQCLIRYVFSDASDYEGIDNKTADIRVKM